ESQDTDFTWDEYVRRTNAELVGGWGNLVNRTVSMAHKNFGEIPRPGTLTDLDAELLRDAGSAFATVGGHLEQSRFKAGATEAMRVVGAANRYIAATEPGKLAKEPDELDPLATVLHAALDAVSDATTLHTRSLRAAAQKVHGAIGGEGVWATAPQVHEVADDMPVDVVGSGVPATGRRCPLIMGD